MKTRSAGVLLSGMLLSGASGCIDFRQEQEGFCQRNATTCDPGTLEVTPATVVADGKAPSTITVRLKSTNGYVIAGQPVTVQVSGSGPLLSSDSAQTDESGTASFTLASTRAEQVTVSATVAGKPMYQSATVTFVAGPVVGLSFQALPSRAVAGSALAPAVQVAAVDAYGNPSTLAEPWVAVTLAGDGPGGVLRGTTAARASGGVATFKDLRVDRAGRYALVASADGLSTANSAAFDIQPGAISQTLSTLEVPAEAFLSSGTAGVQLTVTASDFLGNPIADQLVTLSATGTGHTFTPQQGRTSGTGRFEATLTSTVAEAKTLNATLDSIVLSRPIRFTPLWKSVAAASASTCAVAGNGSLWCWGGNTNGQLGIGTLENSGSPRQVATGKTWLQVALGSEHACAIASDTTLWCWGSNREGQRGTGPFVSGTAPVQVGSGSNWARVTLGAYHSCATRSDGTLWCWGDNYYGQLGIGTSYASIPTQVGTGTDWASVALGGYHTCALRTDDTLWCWGAGGKLGTGTTEGSPVPVRVGVRTGWAGVSVGLRHSCALRTDGTLWCWGDNGNGQLGTGTTAESLVPVQVGTRTDWNRVFLAYDQSCATQTNGSLWCWGISGGGPLGDGTTLNSRFPVRVGMATNWVQWAASTAHTCGLRTDGTIGCWGQNELGQVGAGSIGNKALPSWVEGFLADDGPNSVATRTSHTCSIQAAGTLWCWGANGSGQLGVGTLSRSSSPVQVGTRTDWTSVSVGNDFTCATRRDGTLWCWGANGSGRLGTGTPPATSSTVPLQVGTATDWARVSLGEFHACAIRTDGSLWCWGSNFRGQLGIGTNTDSHTPVRVGTATDWASVSLGLNHTCGTRTSGALWCWGEDGAQLGTGSATGSAWPVRVGTGTDWARVALGAYHSCATRTNGTLWCWGSNWSGQLGLGHYGDSSTPAQVGTGMNWTHVSLGYTHTCATRVDGTLWCWGSDEKGELGNGTSDTYRVLTSPTQVGTRTDWASASLGTGYSCATRLDSSLWCWGPNETGRLGDGTGFYTLPQAVTR